MQDKDFDGVMDTWVEHETESAPEMRPTAGMYRLVRARQKRKPTFFARSRWAALGAAVASLAVVLYVVLFQSSIFRGPLSGRDVAWVGQREGFVSARGVVVEPVAPPEKGPGKGPIFFGLLVFHFQKRDSRSVQSIDLQALRKEALTLTPADNYRLFLEPAEDWYVYVFQLAPSGDLVRLFPNETYSAVQNPLRQGQTYYLPSEPNGFYLDEDAAPHTGEGRLYVVASARALQDLDDLYAQYVQADDEPDRRVIRARLIETFEGVADVYPGEAAAWVLVLDHP